MGFDRDATIASNDSGELLRSFVRGERARALRVQLAARHPERSADEIEDAIQAACKCFLDEAEGISAPGKVYGWLRTAAHRILSHEAERSRREVAVDPSGEGVEGMADDDADPLKALISLEDDADLGMLVEEVSSSLSDRRRDVLALYGAGYKRPQIADRLGLSERTVKRELLAIMDQARAILARLAGGGCLWGEPMVVRFVCGISTPDESARAREHLAHCGRCEAFSERLIAWREKAGAMLPAPVAEGASPGVLERLAQKATEGAATFKQQILDGGAHLKQQAATAYPRAAEYVPSLATGRPGTATALVAGCLAVGGGTAYCVEQGVDPLGTAKGLIASAPESEPPASSSSPESTSPGPVYTPVEPPVSEEPPAAEPAPEVEGPKPESPPPPVPGDSIEPVRTPYQAAEESGAAEAEATEEAAPVEAREPDPVPAHAGPQFGGPG